MAVIGVGINSIHLTRVLVGGIAWLTADITKAQSKLLDYWQKLKRDHIDRLLELKKRSVGLMAFHLLHYFRFG